jgi:hypothetical protein
MTQEQLQQGDIVTITGAVYETKNHGYEVLVNWDGLGHKWTTKDALTFVERPEPDYIEGAYYMSVWNYVYQRLDGKWKSRTGAEIDPRPTLLLRRIQFVD